MKINLYSNGNCLNHGCEAIYLSLAKILNNFDITAYSEFYDDDIKIIKDRVHFKNVYETKNSIAETIIFKTKYKLFKNDKIYFDYKYKPFYKNLKANHQLFLSVGGDNYCYNYNVWLESLNNYIIKKDNEIILAGCSIEKNSIDERLAKTLKSFRYIIARESVTYQNLIDNGLKNVLLIPDPAFVLDTDDIVTNDAFFENDIIGINFSPLILKKAINEKIVYENLCCLIEYILTNTNNNIMLIPHVIIDENNDYEILEKLFDHYKESNRIKLIFSDRATKLKGYISKCKIFIACRTHASIAAYSNCIPTLVIGYSVKSEGIAKDIFGTADKYVIPVQSITSQDMLLNAYKFINENYVTIKNHLKSFMPNYISKCYEYKKLIEDMVNE